MAFHRPALQPRYNPSISFTPPLSLLGVLHILLRGGGTRDTPRNY